ncbi:ATP-dependent dethiobiotin synthetase BioD [Xanthobacter dioxanivorans]|uniref:ATP-dependent dethiobiotin synthetase BioD n=1 Tax=Xanthobacter dioxanivorans TaxID=2528964 RepID=A0A974SJG5_9HYPH|nr:dethiobiotin synthase [Xanthobacter dioxanivorans]QRG08381.1 ATP-dependent dethiobiotin synthetase BioD [Xanthobacter dioxanivorans]
MSRGFIITGTDTDVGKTVFAAALAGALDACYFKPVQAGLDGDTDAGTTRRLSGLPAERILPEAYRLALPASPHWAAEAEGVRIDPSALVLPQTERPLIVEGAGGPLVPLDRRTLFADVFARWGLPVIVCARTGLGTISHSLMAIEALRARGIRVHGVAFIGDAAEEAEAIIAEIGGVRRLGRLPRLPVLTADTLRIAFARAFRRADFSLEGPRP